MSIRRQWFTVLALGVLIGSATSAAAPTASSTPLAVKPVIGKPVVVPARPIAGTRFTVSFKVTRSDTGAPLTAGRMICDPSVAGKVIRHAESFKAGTARASFVIPTSAAGKLLKVKLTIKAAGRSTTAVNTFKVMSAAMPSLSIGDVSAAEGNTGTTTLSFPITLSSPATQTLSVSYATADGTATAPSDYAAASGTLTFKSGEKAKTIPISVVADVIMEQTETFTVTLSNPVEASIGKGTATGTITNDDTAVPVTVGSYKGLIDGNFLFFDVVARYVTHFRSNYIRENCDSGGIYVYGTLDWDGVQFVIGADGTFNASDTATGTVSGQPATFHDEVTGRFDGTNASGTVLGSVEYDRQGVHLKCTSGQSPWTASLQP